MSWPRRCAPPARCRPPPPPPATAGRWRRRRRWAPAPMRRCRCRRPALGRPRRPLPAGTDAVLPPFARRWPSPGAGAGRAGRGPAPPGEEAAAGTMLRRAGERAAADRRRWPPPASPRPRSVCPGSPVGGRCAVLARWCRPRAPNGGDGDPDLVLAAGGRSPEPGALPRHRRPAGHGGGYRPSRWPARAAAAGAGRGPARRLVPARPPGRAALGRGPRRAPIAPALARKLASHHRASPEIVPRPPRRPTPSPWPWRRRPGLWGGGGPPACPAGL